jgi:hypothetical protein
LHYVFAILFLTLPTQPNAVRLRVWRALKTLGCASIRDGTYLLPADRAGLFDPLVEEVRAHGGQASVMQLSSADEAQTAELRALFDRSEAYAHWRAEAEAWAARLATLDEAQARRGLRGTADALQALREIDYYPGNAAEQAASHWNALRQAVDALFSKGEPATSPAHGLPRLDARRFKGRRWATRARPWVDRLACAWLIRRFIDPAARFAWLADPAAAPKRAVGFDFDGADFTHVGARVSFETLLAAFGLETPALQRLGTVVHSLDARGVMPPEAAGVERVLAGMRDAILDDDALMLAAAGVFEGLYQTFDKEAKV